MLKIMYKNSLDDSNIDDYKPETVLRTAPKVSVFMPIRVIVCV